MGKPYYKGARVTVESLLENYMRAKQKKTFCSHLLTLQKKTLKLRLFRGLIFQG